MCMMDVLPIFGLLFAWFRLQHINFIRTIFIMNAFDVYSYWHTRATYVRRAHVMNVVLERIAVGTGWLGMGFWLILR